MLRPPIGARRSPRVPLAALCIGKRVASGGHGEFGALEQQRRQPKRRPIMTVAPRFFCARAARHVARVHAEFELGTTHIGPTRPPRAPDMLAVRLVGCALEWVYSGKYERLI